jgi:hypothetical protein
MIGERIEVTRSELAPAWLAAEVRWDEDHPGRAPQFRCHDCRRWIAKARSLILFSADAPGPEPVIVHIRCLNEPTPRQAHARRYPDCPVVWHDVYDHHDHAMGTRAGIAAVVGVWPRGAR